MRACCVQVEMFNDIIRYLAIEVRPSFFAMSSRLPGLAALYVVMVTPRKDANFIVRCKDRLDPPSAPRDVHAFRPRPERIIDAFWRLLKDGHVRRGPHGLPGSRHFATDRMRRTSSADYRAWRRQPDVFEPLHRRRAKTARGTRSHDPECACARLQPEPILFVRRDAAAMPGP
jgi:hypothetical protein